MRATSAGEKIFHSDLAHELVETMGVLGKEGSVLHAPPPLFILSVYPCRCGDGGIVVSIAAFQAVGFDSQPSQTYIYKHSIHLPSVQWVPLKPTQCPVKQLNGSDPLT